MPLQRTAPNKLFDLDTGYLNQGFVKGEVFCFRYLDFYSRHGESTSTASQLSKESNKVPLFLQNLAPDTYG